ncbi:tryptophan 2,3-dioxygenase [Alteromonas sp. MB-3u-76]|uniref:tryptophan 2,3-dioxygenase family protein n=1 Tax=unclassified Alteromonas TaxID=2614992 RepID=UPI000903BC19|nr:MULTISPECIES: tryptophan 2,3-dioxygenase family protein [unclassified Alteromonas]APE05957.1 tryptophan 2,3-dioxygenase [Alteromonas sp. RW2A1]AUC87711.1 tryptophan 2,3-dioxygenase [Alteromonas sp. MB-3u-76]
MKKNIEPCYYGDYLQLDKILGAQKLQSEKYSDAAHEEMLFIIVHQVYELWFKQILHELNATIDTFNQEVVKDQQLTQVVHRLQRVITIQRLMNDQIAVMETMTPQQFLSFRDYLVPASGFQSIQFKRLEISLGLKREFRVDFDKQSFYSRLTDDDRALLEGLEKKPSLFDLVDKWLSRMPLLKTDDFDFWEYYKKATAEMLTDDHDTISTNDTLSTADKRQELKDWQSTTENFDALFDHEKFEKLRKEDKFRLSHEALLSALFIKQYSEEPVFNLPFQLITALTEIDEQLTIWRYRHAMMVQRMLGTKIGTGGSSGHHYLKRTTESNRIFLDFFNMATFLLPKSALPELPNAIKRKLGFYLNSIS